MENEIGPMDRLSDAGAARAEDRPMSARSFIPVYSPTTRLMTAQDLLDYLQSLPPAVRFCTPVVIDAGDNPIRAARVWIDDAGRLVIETE
jgi:hypothetical protein